MSHLAAQREARFTVDDSLLRRELLPCRPPSCRTLPTGHFPVSPLGVVMSIPMEGMDARSLAHVAKVLQVIAVPAVVGLDETALPRQGLRRIDELPLRRGPNGHSPWAPAFGPRGLQVELIALIGQRRDDLDRLLAAQTEERLQGERDFDEGVGD